MKFLFPLIGLCAGILISSELLPGLFVPALAIGAALLVWLLISILSKNPVKAFVLAKWHPLWISLLFLGLGALDFTYNCLSYTSEDIDNRPLTFTGEISEVKYLNSGDRFKIKVTHIQDSLNQEINARNINILLYTDGFLGSKGDVISFPAIVKSLSGKNKDFANRMRHQGILYSANVKLSSIRSVAVSNSLQNKIDALREKLIIKIEKSQLSRSSAEFLISLLLGDKTLLASDTRESLSNAGMAHILAISGMHVAILFSIFLALLFPLSFFGFSHCRRILAIVLIWLYVIFSGASPSTVRAAIMATLLVTAIILQRKHSSLNALLAAAVIILLINPFFLWDIGFQLSFVCVASILIFVNKANPVRQHQHPRTFKLMAATLVTLITTLCTWILTAYYFEIVPLLFLPSNLLLLPLLPAFLTAGLIYLLFLTIGIDITFLANALDRFVSFFISSANTLSFSGDSVFSFHVPPVSCIAWLLAVLCIAFAIYSSSRKMKRVNIMMAVLWMVFSVSWLITYDTAPEKSLRFNHSFTDIRVSSKVNQNTQEFMFPRGSLSVVNHPGFQITAIDNFIKNDSLDKFKNISGNNSFLIVGPSAHIEQIAELINTSSFSKIIFHAGMGKNKKETLMSLLEPLHFDKIYSLRDMGSLEFDL